MALSPQAQGWIVTFVCASVVGGIYEWWKERKYPSYITDERGERQRVIAWSRGQPVFDPKTWQQRIQEEVILRRKRRWHLFWCALAIAIAAAIIHWLWQFSTFIAISALSGAILGCGPLLFIGVPALVQEVLYQFGYQGMQGAQVLDQQPKAQPGREIVETQKAHGDARVAGEAEALSLLNSKK